MSPEQWKKVNELFHAACEKTGADRVALLDSASSDDPSLRVAVEQMLRDHEAADSFLNECVVKLPPSAAAAGRKFGRYETVAPIGRGGMGEVWIAHDSELERDVALKFLIGQAAFGRALERLRREARTVSALNHPNIVTVHEVIAREEAPIIVMELVDGKPLRELCGTPQPLSQLIHIGLQIAQALAAAHEHGIIHRDIKPENMLIRRDGYVKVLDFGLARHFDTDTPASSSRHLPGATLPGGTLRYMSPEQARGEPLTPASDVFSFGLVLYELATGQHAFPRDSPGEAMQAILTEHAAAPSSVNPLVPHQLDSLILSMLAKGPGARPSAEQVARTLNEMQARLAISSGAAGSLLSRRGKWIAIGSLILLTCSLLTWFWNHRTAAQKQPAFYQVTTLVPENRATAAAISPDGRWAAYANVDGIFLRSLRNGETRALRAPRDVVVDRLAWFADAKKLLASGFSPGSNIAGVWTISATGAPPRLLREHARDATPSPDGTRVAFLSQDRSEIWVMGTEGRDSRRVLAGRAEDTFPLLFWSPDGRRIGFQRWRASVNSILKSYESIALATGKVVTGAPNLSMRSAVPLADGRVMYLQWDSGDFTSSNQLWELQTSPRSGAVLGKPRKIATLPQENSTLLELSATADGARAMVLRQSNQNAVFVGDFNQSPPLITNIHRLTLDERTSYPHAWTADSRAVIFESNRNGNFDVFKQHIDQRTSETIVATPFTEMLPQRSPDGRFVLYAAHPPEKQQPWYYKPGTYKLMRVPVDGGTPAEVPIGGRLDQFRCALDPGKRCVLRTTAEGKYYAYYDLDPIRGKGRELARTKWIPGLVGDWDVSPNGKYVAFPNHSSHDARIRMVALEPRANEPREREVVLKDLTDIRGLAWAVGGQAWFVSVDTAIGNRLLYVYLDGRYRSLGDIQGWAVPSPDGRRVAFLDRIIATNAWIIDRR